MKTKNPVILIIRDGWGYRKSKKDNLIAMADTPWNDMFWNDYPHGILQSSGIAVGLPDGYQGNSEVGHMTIGSGRVIFQSLEKINQSIKKGDFFKKEAFLKTITACRKSGGALHLIGLLQTQGVHSHIDHLFALLEVCKSEKFHNVYIHAITDGRDAPVKESLKHVKALEKKLAVLKFGQIATVCGRYYAMDRNNRYERTEEEYNCLLAKSGVVFKNATSYIQASHKSGVSDEFIKPGYLESFSGLQDGDGLIFFNFRTDRPRQLTRALTENSFKEFKRDKKQIHFASMTEYYRPLKGLVAFPDVEPKNLLGELVSSFGGKQLRISETEKYAHVTFFFNGQKEKPSKGEDRILIQSPHVATYDLKPEMSVSEIATRLSEEIRKKKYDLIVTNLVNGDMVGHTADHKAIKIAIEAVDKAMGEIVSVGLGYGYTSLIFADHGNAEDKGPKCATSHTLNPVPFMLVSPDKKLAKVKIKEGLGLQDIATTALKIMGIKKSKEMTGKAAF